MNDIAIIDLFYSRDDSAVLELEKKYGAEMKNYAKRYLRDSRDGEEAYNDTLFEVWNSIPPERPKNLRAYIMSILKCKAIDKLRYSARKKRRQHEEILFSEFEYEDGIFADSDSSLSAEEEFMNSSAGFINEFLGEETSENRRIFVKRYYYGKSVAEIAKELGVTEGSLCTRLSRIRSRLNKFITGKELFK